MDDETILLDLIRALRILPDELVYELLIPLEASHVVLGPLRVDPENPDGIDPICLQNRSVQPGLRDLLTFDTFLTLILLIGAVESSHIPHFFPKSF